MDCNNKNELDMKELTKLIKPYKHRIINIIETLFYFSEVINDDVYTNFTGTELFYIMNKLNINDDEFEIINSCKTIDEVTKNLIDLYYKKIENDEKILMYFISLFKENEFLAYPLAKRAIPLLNIIMEYAVKKSIKKGVEKFKQTRVKTTNEELKIFQYIQNTHSDLIKRLYDNNTDIEFINFIDNCFGIWGKAIFLKKPNKTFTAFEAICIQKNINRSSSTGKPILFPLISSILTASNTYKNKYDILIFAMMLDEHISEQVIHKICTAEYKSNKIMDNRTFATKYSNLKDKYKL